MLSGFKFTFIFKSKSGVGGTNIDLNNGSVMTNQKTSSTNKPKSNLQKKEKKGKNRIKVDKRKRKKLTLPPKLPV